MQHSVTSCKFMFHFRSFLRYVAVRYVTLWTLRNYVIVIGKNSFKLINQSIIHFLKQFNIFMSRQTVNEYRLLMLVINVGDVLSMTTALFLNTDSVMSL